MFIDFKKVLQERLNFLIENSVALFQVEVDADELWNLYLDSFPEGTNSVYREKREYDCNCCKSFVRHYGSIVGIVGGEVVSLWDVETEHPFQDVSDALTKFIGSKPIKNIFYTKEVFGKDTNFDANRVEHPQYNHLYYKFDDRFVKHDTPTLKGKVRQTKQVIQRSLNELTKSAVQKVVDWIDDNVLYRGDEHGEKVKQFLSLMDTYDTENDKDAFCWVSAVQYGRIAAIRNTAIGTLLVNLSEGMDDEEAVKKYERVVAPTNYKRPKPLYTAAMKKAAETKVVELGLMKSLGRRFAQIEDVNLRNVIWASGDSAKVMQSPFDLLSSGSATSQKVYEGSDDINIERFIKEVLPSTKDLQVLFENSHQNNLMSLLTAQDKDAPSLFSWDNEFSHAYNNDVTDSIREAVAARGGKVDGVLRFSLMWAEGDATDNSDLDAHCQLPGSHIYYSKSVCSRTGGRLDVDITNPNNKGNKNIVENITWANRKNLVKGDYNFYVKNFALRGNQKGFRAEIEFDGEIFEFECTKGLRNGEMMKVATVNFDGERFTMKETHLTSSVSSKVVWGVDSQQFAKVSTVMFSPNHWGHNKGNKHYFFFIEGCSNPNSPRGFFNEFLRGDLQEHRKVFEALGDKMRVPHETKQMSGLGFSSTMVNKLTVKVDGRPFNITF